VNPLTRRCALGAAGLLAGVATLLAGAGPARSVAVAVLVAAVAVVSGETRIRDTGWPARLAGPGHPAWSEVERLAQVIDAAPTQPERFDRVARARLARLAHEVLARRGVGWDQPRAAQLLGELVWAGLDAGLRLGPERDTETWRDRDVRAERDASAGRDAREAMQQGPDARTDGRTVAQATELPPGELIVRTLAALARIEPGLDPALDPALDLHRLDDSLTDTATSPRSPDRRRGEHP